MWLRGEAGNHHVAGGELRQTHGVLPPFDRLGRVRLAQQVAERPDRAASSTEVPPSIWTKESSRRTQPPCRCTEIEASASFSRSIPDSPSFVSSGRSLEWSKTQTRDASQRVATAANVQNWSLGPRTGRPRP